MKKVLFFLLLLPGCIWRDEDETPIRFFVIGDWGRDGQFRQKELADIMNEIARNARPDFILSAGDNFYEDGVDNVNDPQWKTSFEDIYNGESLSMPWYVCLGNHDYMGNVQAQIDYHLVNNQWNMPARYYTIRIQKENTPSLRIVVTDTSPFEKSYYSAPWKDHVIGQDTARQKIWVDSLLALQDADWTMALGHHPVYTGGARANEASSIRQSLESIFTEQKLPIYLAGHEHDLQHLKDPTKPTHHFISGAGSLIRPTGSIAITKFSESIQGFMLFTVYRRQVIVQVYSVEGKVIYQAELIKE